jgi:hypothetical protein
MYSEDKRMLKDTLHGISRNIANLIKSGIAQDQIVVIVVADGIEKLDQSIVDYF